MITIYQVLGMLASVAVYSSMQTAQAAAAAYTFGALTGAAGGGIVAAAVARPSWARAVLAFLFQAISAPFYYLGGDHAQAQRFRVLEETSRELASAAVAYIEKLKNESVSFPPFRITYSAEYLAALETQLQSGTGLISNPIKPFCTAIQHLKDPFDNTYTVIMLDPQGRKGVMFVTAVVAIGTTYYLVRYLIKIIIRYSIRGTKAVKSTIEREQAEEALRESKKEYMEQAMKN